MLMVAHACKGPAEPSQDDGARELPDLSGSWTISGTGGQFFPRQPSLRLSGVCALEAMPITLAQDMTHWEPNSEAGVVVGGHHPGGRRDRSGSSWLAMPFPTHIESSPVAKCEPPV